MTNLEARRGAESRRHGRAYDVITNSAERVGFNFRGLFRRGGASHRTSEWRNQVPTEFELGRQLTSLDDRFTVLRAFDVFGELDADFVVVGPGGVFLVTTRTKCAAKIWIDEEILWVDGRATNQVRDARIAAHRASSRLSSIVGYTVRATPVIAVMDPLTLSFGGDPALRVVTLPADLVVQWISECSRTLSDDAVASLAVVAEQRATWGSLPSGSSLLSRVR